MRTETDTQLYRGHRPKDIDLFFARDALGAGEEELVLEIGLVIESLEMGGGGQSG